MLSSPKNQGAELPPGAGLISCAVGRFTGLGGRPLPPQKTDTASLLVPWDTLVFRRNILSVFERLNVFSLWSKYSGHRSHNNKCADLGVSTVDKLGQTGLTSQ